MLIKKVIILICCLVCSRACKSQITLSPDKHTTLFGGQIDEVFWARGLYVLRPDFKFIFIGTNKVRYYGTDNSDTIRSVGSGTWHSNSKFVFFNFDSTLLNLVKAGDIVYHAYCKEPFDSLSLKIEITNNDPRTRGVYAIGNLGKTFLFFTDSSKTHFRIPLPLSGETLEIAHPLYEKEFIPLFKSYNNHELKIKLGESNVMNQLQGPIGSFQFLKSEMSEIEDARDYIIRLIDQGMIVFPKQKSFLVHLRNFVQ